MSSSRTAIGIHEHHTKDTPDAALVPLETARQTLRQNYSERPIRQTANGPVEAGDAPT